MIDPSEIQKKFIDLSPDQKNKVIDLFILFEEEKKRKEKKIPTFDWEGALSDLKEQYTSVELQHKIHKWHN